MMESVKKFFGVLLCVFPILCLCLRVFWEPEDVLVRVAVYCEGDSELAKQTVLIGKLPLFPQVAPALRV